MQFNLIVQTDLESGIGVNADNFCDLVLHHDHLANITSHVSDKSKYISAVIMGRNTYLSIPQKLRPFNNNVVNVVVSKTLAWEDVPNGVFIRPNFNAALELLKNDWFHKQVESVFVIGGEELFRECLFHHKLKYVFMTLVDGNFNCNRFLPCFVPNYITNCPNDYLGYTFPYNWQSEDDVRVLFVSMRNTHLD